MCTVCLHFFKVSKNVGEVVQVVEGSMQCVVLGSRKHSYNWEGVVEMDETYLPGQPKYHRGRRLGTTWKPEDK